jgi:flagellar biosynthesis/type III secretory pathway protein FliH
LKTQQTAQDPASRLEWKLRFVKALYRKGFERKDIIELFRFIDWLMILPKDLEIRFEETLEHFEQEEKMPYITNIERRGIEKGVQQGIQQGTQHGEALMLKRLLRHRFGDLPEAIERQLDTAESAELEALAGRVLDAKSLADVFPV